MASADVRRANQATGKKVRLGDGTRFYIDEQVFNGNPRMATKKELDCVWVPNYPNHRPYVKAIENKRIIFNDDFSPQPGEIWLKDPELEYVDKLNLPDQFILVEPTVKDTYVHTINKAWHKWDSLLSHKLPWIQVGQAHTAKDARFIKTQTFRQALAILGRATLFVGTDGALHHAAAALNVPAVVLWSGFTSPKHLGYADHVNIHDGSDPCGYFGGVCSHCRKKADAIDVETVIEAVEDEYEKHTRRLVA
jgi:hypothetical protein